MGIAVLLFLVYVLFGIGSLIIFASLIIGLIALIRKESFKATLIVLFVGIGFIVAGGAALAAVVVNTQNLASSGDLFGESGTFAEFADKKASTINE